MNEVEVQVVCLQSLQRVHHSLIGSFAGMLRIPYFGGHIDGGAREGGGYQRILDDGLLSMRAKCGEQMTHPNLFLIIIELSGINMTIPIVKSFEAGVSAG